MKNLSIKDMMHMSHELYEENKETWSPMEPEHGKDFIECHHKKPVSEIKEGEKTK